MKKIVLAMILLVALLFNCVALASCGNRNQALGDFVVPENGYDGSEVTIKFYHTMGQNLKPVLESTIAAFNELYPNIHIEEEAVGGYDDVRDQIKTEITVGNQPHIAYCYPDHVALYNLAKAVVTLDDLIASEIVVNRADGSTEPLGLTQTQIDDFIKGYYDEGKQFGDDKMYTMPLSKSTEVLYYNKTFFDQHDLTVPTTWDEMETVLKQIKAIDPSCTPLGYDSEANWFITMCEQQGSAYTSATGDHFLFANDENYAFVERFAAWHREGLVTTKEISGGYTSALFTNQEEGGTRSYMSIGSSAGATKQRPTKVNNEYPFDVGIATIPQVDPANPKVISQGPSVCIFKKANPQEVVASWLFVKYMITSPAFLAQFSMASGYVPPIKSIINEPKYKAFLDSANGGDGIAALAAKICMEQEHAYYTSPAFNGSSTARDQVGLLIQQCFQFDPKTTPDIPAAIRAAFAEAVARCQYEVG